MYHKASISPLSSTQVSKILNGHSVRVSAGNGHDIELSKEQFKKFSRAHKNRKAMTLTLSIYAVLVILNEQQKEALNVSSLQELIV